MLCFSKALVVYKFSPCSQSFLVAGNQRHTSQSQRKVLNILLDFSVVPFWVLKVQGNQAISQQLTSDPAPVCTGFSIGSTAQRRCPAALCAICRHSFPFP